MKPFIFSVMYSEVHWIEHRQYTYSQITTAYTSEHS